MSVIDDDIGTGQKTTNQTLTQVRSNIEILHQFQINLEQNVDKPLFRCLHFKKKVQKGSHLRNEISCFVCSSRFEMDLYVKRQ